MIEFTIPKWRTRSVKHNNALHDTLAAIQPQSTTTNEQESERSVHEETHDRNIENALSRKWHFATPFWDRKFLKYDCGFMISDLTNLYLPNRIHKNQDYRKRRMWKINLRKVVSKLTDLPQKTKVALRVVLKKRNTDISKIYPHTYACNTEIYILHNSKHKGVIFSYTPTYIFSVMYFVNDPLTRGNGGKYFL